MFWPQLVESVSKNNGRHHAVQYFVQGKQKIWLFQTPKAMFPFEDSISPRKIAEWFWFFYEISPTGLNAAIIVVKTKNNLEGLFF